MIIAVVFVTTTFVFSLLGLVDAQQPVKTALPRVGLISSSGGRSDPWPHLEAFRAGLKDLGYVEGKNIQLELRYGEGRLDRMPQLVQEFVEANVDVIVGVNNVVIRAAKEATKTIPIVMISSVDPVAAKYVESFARPGGNITGMAWLSRDLGAKRIELIRELFPRVSKIGILWDEEAPGPKVAYKEYTTAAHGFKTEILSLAIRGPKVDFHRAFQTAKAAGAGAVIVVGNPLLSQHLKPIFELATRNRIPTMTEEARYVEAGGLISYGANLAQLYRRAAEYVVDILKGHKPADLPVKLATKFEIIVNLKTAKQIGVTIPQHVLVQADKVIK